MNATTTEQTRTAVTPMADHVARFWDLLAANHVRILVDMRREHADGPSHWDSASYSDDVAKALLTERMQAATAIASLRERNDVLEKAHRQLMATLDAQGERVRVLEWALRMCVDTIHSYHGDQTSFDGWQNEEVRDVWIAGRDALNEQSALTKQEA